MIVLAQKIVKERERELLKWLRGQYREAMRNQKRLARGEAYGDAHYAQGLAAAYAYAILHVDRMMVRKGFQ